MTENFVLIMKIDFLTVQFFLKHTTPLLGSIRPKIDFLSNRNLCIKILTIKIFSLKGRGKKMEWESSQKIFAWFVPPPYLEIPAIPLVC